MLDFAAEPSLVTRRAMRGARSYHAGLAAEEQVSRHYERLGRPIAARRWRCAWGEIDLVAHDGDTTVFIEVKASSTHAEASSHFGRRQYDRICAACTEFVNGEPNGQMTDVRLDLALVDGLGRIEVIEGVYFD